MMTLHDEAYEPNEIAERIVEIVTAAGYRARAWDKGALPRVYVERNLSRGWTQMGYVEVLPGGERNYNAIAPSAAMRNLIEPKLSV